MNFEWAKQILESGGRVRRPIWKEDSYWELSKDGFGRILWADGFPAKIHLRQLEENDWESWSRPITQERIGKKINEFILKTGNNPNIIKFSDRQQDFLCVAMKLFGMEIRVDDSLAPGEFEIGYKAPKEKSLSDKEWSSCCFKRHGDPGYAEADLKYYIGRLQENLKGHYGINRPTYESIIRMIKKEFGERLCSK